MGAGFFISACIHEFMIRPSPLNSHPDNDCSRFAQWSCRVLHQARHGLSERAQQCHSGLFTVHMRLDRFVSGRKKCQKTDSDQGCLQQGNRTPPRFLSNDLR